MAHDLLIKDGLIVDGTGADAYHGDVAVDGDTITAVGKVEGKAQQVIDADGRAVTPGFVDLHTHFDAQAGWDPYLTPVSWHGVTTALFGNCGVTFAPCKPEDQEFLAGMMETVEDIPKRAILEGLPWDWESYGEYLDSIEKLNPAINITGMVGHCAARFYVMGERSITDNATPEEIEQIATLIGESVKDGAIGFSSNRLPGHTLPDGRSIPGTYAEKEELVAIAKQVGEHGGIVQNVLNYSNLASEMDLVRAQVKSAGTRILFSAPQIPNQDGPGFAYDKPISEMRDEGLDVVALTLPRSGGFLSGLRTDILVARSPQWRELIKLSFDERLAAIRDSEYRQKLIDEVKGRNEANALRQYHNFFWLGSGEQPQYTKDSSESLASLAEAAGEHPVETWIRFMLDSDGEAFFHVRFFNTDLEHLESFLKQEYILPGLGDAGAHVSQIMDSGWTSFMLNHWVHNKAAFSLEDAIRRLTSAQARVIGFNDRGTIAEGKRADLNVIDVGRVAERIPKLVYDFPNSAPRLIQKAVGYGATVCNGEVILRDDEHTGARAGRVLRNPNT